MTEMVLPGTYIEVRAEGLNIAGPISIGNIGMVGTANKGPAETPVLLGSMADARAIFGTYDAWGAENNLTLVRALEQAYRQGASSVYAVRIGSEMEIATHLLETDGVKITLKAKSPGTWGNLISVVVETGASANKLKITFRLDKETESYDISDAGDLEQQLIAKSKWIDVEEVIPSLVPKVASVKFLTGGKDGETAAATDYEKGLEVLFNVNVQIIVAAGQDASFGDELAAHCLLASSDDYQRERIAIVGFNGVDPSAISNNVDSGRVILVAPGFKTSDAAATPPKEITLPAAYTAAALAGLISSMPAHQSPTNKVLNLGDLETIYNKAQLQALMLNRVCVLEQRQGIKIVKGITTATETAWTQITTRRIVDFAKFGTRSAANPFIGKLNNERVRGTLKGSINSFLAGMVDREMLTTYELEVTANRSEEIQGIVKVAMALQPTFSIDYISVVMYLQ